MKNPKQIQTVKTRPTDQGLVVYDWQRHHSHILNTTASFIWQQCDGQTPHQTLVQSVQQQFNMTAEHATELVWLTMAELEKAHLLEPETVTPAPHSLVNRRQLLKSFAAVGLSAILLPTVSTAIEPGIAHAAANPTAYKVEGHPSGGDGIYNFGGIQNGKPVYVLGNRKICWSGSAWQILNNLIVEYSHPTDVGSLPPQINWTTVATTTPATTTGPTTTGPTTTTTTGPTTTTTTSAMTTTTTTSAMTTTTTTNAMTTTTTTNVPSDQNIKENFGEVNPIEILARVVNLSI